MAVARALIGGGLAGLCLSGFAAGGLPASAIPSGVPSGTIAAGAAAVLAALALLWSAVPLSTLTVAVAAVWAGSTTALTAAGISGLVASVPAAEALLLAIATLVVGGFDGARRALALAVAGTLTLFGLVHLVEAPVLAGLIPSWLPWRAVGPYLTGTLMIALGLLALLPRLHSAAAHAAAILFASWLPIVHLPRLLADPTDPNEQQFALMALCLIGALLASARRKPVERQQQR